MPKTVESSTQLYLPVSEFLKRVDPNIVANLCSDNISSPVPISALPTDPNLIAAIVDACGLFESAVLLGERYIPDDILNMIFISVNGVFTTNLLSPLPVGAGLIFRLLSNLTWINLWSRRPNKGAPLPPDIEWTKEFLEQLSCGVRIIGFVETERAGHPHFHNMSPREVRREELTTWIAERYFGFRSNMLDCWWPW